MKNKKLRFRKKTLFKLSRQYFSHYPSNILIHVIKAIAHHPQFYQKWVDMAGNHQNPAKYGS